MTDLRAFARPGALLAGLSLVLLAACGGGGTGVDSARVVTRVDVSAPADHLEVGSTLALTAVARNRDGEPVAGKSFAWTSSDGARAGVSAGGVVTALQPGPVTVTASVDGVAGSRVLTVDPAAVAGVTVAPAAVALSTGQTRQLAATAHDAGGNALAGRPVSWQSTAPGVATVSDAGLVTAVSNGQARVVATVEGKADTAEVSVAPPPVVRLEVSPGFAAADVSELVNFSVRGYFASGQSAVPAQTGWSMLPGGTVTVLDPTGWAVRASAGSPGVYRVAAAADQARDTAVLAVLGPATPLSTAFPGDSVRLGAAPGALVSVPVVLDITRAGIGSDLGSVQFELTFDPAVLAYESHQVMGAGLTDVSVSAGKVAYAMAATQPQSSPRATLLVVNLRVSALAQPGTRRALTLTYTAAPTSVSFAPLEMPVSVGGSIRVVAPAPGPAGEILNQGGR